MLASSFRLAEIALYFDLSVFCDCYLWDDVMAARRSQGGLSPAIGARTKEGLSSAMGHGQNEVNPQLLGTDKMRSTLSYGARKK